MTHDDRVKRVAEAISNVKGVKGTFAYTEAVAEAAIAAMQRAEPEITDAMVEAFNDSVEDVEGIRPWNLGLADTRPHLEAAPAAMRGAIK